MAVILYSNRTGAISTDAFERLIHGISVQPHWADLDHNLETAALMAATALQFGAWLEQNAGLLSAQSPLDPIAAQASEHASMAIETVASLSMLADQFGGVTRS